ncbi:unnamed protein product [Ascophyllum nodosum]
MFLELMSFPPAPPLLPQRLQRTFLRASFRCITVNLYQKLVSHGCSSIFFHDCCFGLRRLLREGVGSTVPTMMRNCSLNVTAQRGGFATLAAISASDEKSRRYLHRTKRGAHLAIVSAFEAFPEDRRTRCEGLLAVQSLSLSTGGARVLAKAGVAPVLVRLLWIALGKDLPDNGVGDVIRTKSRFD